MRFFLRLADFHLHCGHRLDFRSGRDHVVAAEPHPRKILKVYESMDLRVCISVWACESMSL